MPDLAIRPLDERAYALLAGEGFGSDLFNPTQHVACELVEAYATELALDLCRQLDLQDLLATPRTVADVRGARCWCQEITFALQWLLDRLSQTGYLVHAIDGYRLAAPLPPSQREAIRARGLTTDASYAPAYELLDEAAAAFPVIARGETTGERALFGKVTLWIRYFDNRNSYYALNNRVAAPAATARLAQGAHVLEVGAGLGSATEALLEALAGRDAVGRIASYCVTEPVAFFLRRAQRTLTGLHANVPYRFAPLDLNQPWAAQGVDLASQHLVWGVNVFHLARDLDAVLREAHATLAPGGWLVVGEGMRPFTDCVVGAELPFRLLESFTDVRLDPATRPTPGFLTAEHWIGALERAGFDDVTVVPNVIRLRAHYPGMLAAAVCGRRR
jgi:SAM-dependent methyltransferase